MLGQIFLVLLLPLFSLFLPTFYPSHVIRLPFLLFVKSSSVEEFEYVLDISESNLRFYLLKFFVVYYIRFSKKNFSLDLEKKITTFLLGVNGGPFKIQCCWLDQMNEVYFHPILIFLAQLPIYAPNSLLLWFKSCLLN